MPEKAPRNGIPEKIRKNDIPEKAPRNGMPGRAPRNGISEGAPKNGVLKGTPRNGVPEGASKNGVSERAPFVDAESVIFHQLPTSVTRNGRTTFVSVIPSYSVEWRIEAMSHSDGPRLCGTLTI
jgi:hypothetical protein